MTAPTRCGASFQTTPRSHPSQAPGCQPLPGASSCAGSPLDAPPRVLSDFALSSTSRIGGKGIAPASAALAGGPREALNPEQPGRGARRVSVQRQPSQVIARALL